MLSLNLSIDCFLQRATLEASGDNIQRRETVGDTQMHLTHRLELKMQTRRVRAVPAATWWRLKMSPKIRENLMRLYWTNCGGNLESQFDCLPPIEHALVINGRSVLYCSYAKRTTSSIRHGVEFSTVSDSASKYEYQENSWE